MHKSGVRQKWKMSKNELRRLLYFQSIKVSLASVSYIFDKLGGTTCIGFKFGNHLHKLQIKPPLDGAICIVPNLTIRSYKFSLLVAPLAFDPKVTRWRHLHFQVEILLVYFLLTVSPLQAIHFILLTFHNCLKLRLTRLQIA